MSSKSITNKEHPLYIITCTDYEERLIYITDEKPIAIHPVRVEDDKKVIALAREMAQHKGWHNWIITDEFGNYVFIRDLQKGKEWHR